MNESLSFVYGTLYCDQFVLAVILMWVSYELWWKSCINSVGLNTKSKNRPFAFSVCVCVCACARTCVYIYIYVCVRMYVWLCVYVCACLCVYTCMLIFIWLHFCMASLKVRERDFLDLWFHANKTTYIYLGNYNNTKGIYTHSWDLEDRQRYVTLSGNNKHKHA